VNCNREYGAWSLYSIHIYVCLEISHNPPALVFLVIVEYIEDLRTLLSKIICSITLFVFYCTFMSDFFKEERFLENLFELHVKKKCVNKFLLCTLDNIIGYSGQLDGFNGCFFSFQTTTI
jgi:hypothetical protein